MALAAAAGLAAACGRTEINPFLALTTDAAVDRSPDVPRDVPPDLPRDVPPDLPRDVPPDLPRDLPPDLPRDVPPDVPPDRPMDVPPDRPDVGPDLGMEHPPDHPCVPTTEVCNGVDDDCDGLVDEDQPPIPCENGGNRYCVAGGYSECPKRCEACIPGSSRTCFTSFCTFWGSQPCTPDGRSFGPCKEAKVPAECKSITDKGMRTADLEQCCITYGYCCLDEFDLNNNGDRTDMIGQCEAVACTP